MAATHDELVVLSVHECLELLRTSDVGRLAVSRAEHPDVFPVNYAVDHGTVVFRTAPGTKLDAITEEPNVTFEVDGYDRSRRVAWSVVIKGCVEQVTAHHDRFSVADLPLFPWHTAPKPNFVRIVPVEMTGRKFHARRSTTAQRAASAPRRASHE